MAYFLQDRSCNDDFVPLPPPTIVDNSMDIEGESMENDNNNNNNNNNEEIIVNVNANDEMDIEVCVVQRKREEDEDEDDDDEEDDDDLMYEEEEADDDEEEEDDDDEEEEDDLMYEEEEEEEGDVYQHVALLEAENEDLRQQLANANNVVPSRIPFPDGYHIGFEYVNGVRYLFVYQQPVNNGPLSLADLQDDEVLSIINPDDIIKEKESDDEEEDNEDEDEDDDEMDISK